MPAGHGSLSFVVLFSFCWPWSWTKLSCESPGGLITMCSALTLACCLFSFWYRLTVKVIWLAWRLDLNLFCPDSCLLPFFFLLQVDGEVNLASLEAWSHCVLPWLVPDAFSFGYMQVDREVELSNLETRLREKELENESLHVQVRAHAARPARPGTSTCCTRILTCYVHTHIRSYASVIIILTYAHMYLIMHNIKHIHSHAIIHTFAHMH